MSDNYNISYKTEERTALVLSGGGARGAFQAGVLQVLRGYILAGAKINIRHLWVSQPLAVNMLLGK